MASEEDILRVVEKRLKLVSARITYGLFIFTPLVLTPNLTIDPVNLGKFFFFVLAGSIALIQLIGVKFDSPLRRRFLVLGGLLLVGTLFPLLFSGAPIQQQLFGVWGRNTGLITAFACFISMIFAGTIANKVSETTLITYILFCALLSIVYGLVQSLGYDFIPWKAPDVFGTLGNINFYSAHIAMIASVILGLLFSSKYNAKQKLVLRGLLLGCLYLLYQAHSLQGVVALCLSVSILLHIAITRKFPQLKLLVPLITLFVILLGALKLLGITPFANFESSDSSSLKIRTYFWIAALKMFQQRPLYGIGFDSFEDWYRSSRPLSAYMGGDLNEAADSAHNLILDYATVGGFLLFIYILYFLYSTLRAIASIVNQSISDSDTVSEIKLALALSSMTFVVQSMVSPQQIGLMCWGFVLSGLVQGFAKDFSHSTESSVKAKRVSKISKSSKYKLSQSLLRKIAVGSVLIYIVFQPASLIYKESRLISAQKSESLTKFFSAVRSYPTSAYYYRNGISILESAGYLGAAARLGVIAIGEYPRNYKLLETVSSLKAIDTKTKVHIENQLESLNPRR